MKVGNISYWADDIVNYDEKLRKVINSAKANAMITPAYREPWKFPG